MKKRFVVIAGAASLLAIIGCSGGSWEETNAFTPVADASVSGELSEGENSVPTESSSSADVKYSSDAYSSAYVNAGTTAEPEPDSVTSGIQPQIPAGYSDQPKGGVSSSASTLSPSSYAVPSSSAAIARSSANSTNLPTTSSDTLGKTENPTSSDKDSSYIPFEPPMVETMTIGSQVWMKELAAGGTALDWDSAMAPGACPKGFRLPTYGEADSLLHMNADGSLADRNEDGIGIITGGSKRVRDIGWSEHFGRFWTAEVFGESGAYYFAVSDTEDDALLHGDNKNNEFYVRCIKD